MKSWISYIIIGILASVIVFLLVKEPTEKVVTETRVFTYSTYDYKVYAIPHYKYEEIIRYDTLRIRDTIELSIPIVQRTYEDSTYTAWISGYKPQLDSIKFQQKTIFINTTTTEQVSIASSRWAITAGLNVGVGYVAPFNSSTGTIGMYTGVGVTFGVTFGDNTKIGQVSAIASRWTITTGLNMGVGYIAPFDSSNGAFGMYTGVGIGFGYRF